MCGKGGEVFMVPTQQGQRKPKWPTHKEPGGKKEKEKEKKKKAQQRNIANGAKLWCGVRFPWTWTCGVPMDVCAWSLLPFNKFASS